MVRWVIIIILFYLIYQVLKGLINPPEPKNELRRNTEPEKKSGQPEELVRDPFNGTYFPRSEGVAYMVDGRLLYFLNEESRDKYLLARQAKN